MREIKFRAYHIAEKVMCDVSIINCDQGAFLVGVKPGKDEIYDKSIVLAPTDGRFCDFSEFMLLQYTGLKDKNKVDIYVGDLVLMNIIHDVDSRKDSSFSEVDADNNRSFKKIAFLPCEVRPYKDGGYEFYNHEFNIHKPFWISYKDIGGEGERVGNIHENPELLDNTK